MKFTDLALAISFTNRAFETTATSLRIVFHDYPYYIVCSQKEAIKLVKHGYQLANI